MNSLSWIVGAIEFDGGMSVNDNHQLVVIDWDGVCVRNGRRVHD